MLQGAYRNTRFSQGWLSRVISSLIQCRVVQLGSADVSEQNVASIFDDYQQTKKDTRRKHAAGQNQCWRASQASSQHEASRGQSLLILLLASCCFVFSYSSTLKIKVTWSSETLVEFYLVICHCMPEDRVLHNVLIHQILCRLGLLQLPIFKISNGSSDLILLLWFYSPFLGLRRFFSFLVLYTVGSTPWTGVQPVARPLPTHRTTQTQNNRTQYRHLCLEWDSNLRSQLSSKRK
jgi:hypothetical protein